MDSVDGSDHYSKTSDGKHEGISLSYQTDRAELLYPPPSPSSDPTSNGATHSNGTLQNGNDSDVEMADGDETPEPTISIAENANHYRPFRQIQTTLLAALRTLYRDTSPSSLTPTTSIAGALTLALTYINKQQQLASTTTASTNTSANTADPSSTTQGPSLLPRILILSVSGDLAHQYIPMMNTIFACQRLNIPIDICKISGDTVFLQQASDATHGTYMKLEHPRGLLQYLMMAFLPDQTARRWLVQATAVGVDFRAACFCHRKVVDIGWVCSICLSSES
ncbi:MAG: hypothetical protein Q9217_003461 [Psora testacea]